MAVGTYADYTTALAAFVASPTETTKLAVLAALAALPASTTDDGKTATMINGSTLEAMLQAGMSASTSAATVDRKRIIKSRISYGH